MTTGSEILNALAGLFARRRATHSSLPLCLSFYLTLILSLSLSLSLSFSGSLLLNCSISFHAQVFVWRGKFGNVCSGELGRVGAIAVEWLGQVSGGLVFSCGNRRAYMAVAHRHLPPTHALSTVLLANKFRDQRKYQDQILSREVRCV